ncbi:hypothetical protein SGPA1_21388 [Streptomyces misionensis JCM 4497]
MDRPTCAQGLGGGGRGHLCHVRRHPRHGRQPYRLHGPRGLPGLGVQGPLGAAGGQRARLPHPAGELHGDPGVGAPARGRLRSPAAAGPHAAPAVAVRQDRARGL